VRLSMAMNIYKVLDGDTAYEDQYPDTV